MRNPRERRIEPSHGLNFATNTYDPFQKTDWARTGLRRGEEAPSRSMAEKHTVGVAKEQADAISEGRVAREGSPEKGFRAEAAPPGRKGLSVDMPPREDGPLSPLTLGPAGACCGRSGGGCPAPQLVSFAWCMSEGTEKKRHWSGWRGVGCGLGGPPMEQKEP